MTENVFIKRILHMNTFRFHTGDIDSYIASLGSHLDEDPSHELEQILKVQLKDFKEYHIEGHENSDICINAQKNNIKIHRDKHVVTLKLFLENFEPSYIREAINATLKELDTDFLEHIIISFPPKVKRVDEVYLAERHKKILKVWQEAEKLVDENIVMLIGVADLSMHELHKLIEHAKISPSINQVHQYDDNLKKFADENSIELLFHSDPVPFPTKQIFKDICDTNECLRSFEPIFIPRWTARYVIWAPCRIILEGKGYIFKFDKVEIED